MLGLFLAVLELVRRRAISVRQDEEDGGIVIGLRAGEDSESVPAQTETTDSAELPA
jgi:chromatin segregation and condensation protein Rec8/ScpA/Scc1 (kleisin family)